VDQSFLAGGAGGDFSSSAAAGLTLRLDRKSLLAEVGVEAEGGSQASGTHYLKTHAIDQTQLPAAGCQDSVHTRMVLGFSGPNDLKHRIYVFMEHADRRRPQTVLHQRDRFE
jgi:hypothetical protein